MSTVPNAIPGRDSIEVEIFGMEGIPEEDRLAHERTKTGKLSTTPHMPRPTTHRVCYMHVRVLYLL